MRITIAGVAERVYKWLGNYACSDCGCRFEITMEDMDTESQPRLSDNGLEAWYIVECPTCKRDVYRKVK